MSADPWEKFEKLRKPFPEHDNDWIKQQKCIVEHAEEYSERTYYLRHLDGRIQNLVQEKESKIRDNDYPEPVGMLELNYFDSNGVVVNTMILYSAGNNDVCETEFAQKYPFTNVLYQDGKLVQKFIGETELETFMFYDEDENIKAIARIIVDGEASSIELSEMMAS